ncbi:MAG: DNA mismatch repair endonuclease MutL [Clostridia bacterium]|nr:DNA mismatch repair endonuclease MutL [Clostridia bacterium]
MKIKLLDEAVANKIAAGEVVERPASIVKELTENSLDAGATVITIEILGGGIDLIRILDNGCGMEEEDVKNAFLRHATSKISSAEELNNILTLGFRGEALASIAAVSHVRLQTRTPESEEGTEIELSGGEIEKFFSCGCPEGTGIWVRDLFYNTPARKKFLKRPSQEAAYVTDAVQKLALSHPEVSFRFTSEGRQILRTPGDGRLASCVRAIFGAQTAAHMIPIEVSERGITLTGLLGAREIQRNNRTGQILFINGRSVKNEIVSSAVQQGYAGRLNIGKFPMFVLNMTLAGTLVDVNVHPAKQEVRFADGLPVFDVVSRAVADTLRKNQEIPALFEQPAKQNGTRVVEVANVRQEVGQEPETVSRREISAPVKDDPIADEVRDFVGFARSSSGVLQVRDDAELAKILLRGTAPERTELAVKDTHDVFEAMPAEPENDAVQTDMALEEAPPQYRVAGILFDTYILLEAGDDAYLIDQHAAHERLLFEKFFAQAGEKSASQWRLVPDTVKLAPREAAILEDLIPQLEELGFVIDSMGYGTFAVKATPAVLEETDAQGFIASLLDESASLRVLKTNELKRSKLMQLACKSAVKGGDKLTEDDVRALMKLIVREKTPLSCPHGRPILIRLTKHELEVRFKRIQ